MSLLLNPWDQIWLYISFLCIYLIFCGRNGLPYIFPNLDFCKEKKKYIYNNKIKTYTIFPQVLAPPSNERFDYFSNFNEYKS